jgi:hypothetical protein
MIGRILGCLFLAFALASAADAHGGGGGVYVSVYSVPKVVPAAHTADYARIRTVAVVSAIGQTLTVQRTTVLLPQSGSLDIAGWKLDEQMESALQHYLADRFEFRDIHADRAALAHIPNGIWNYSKPAVRSFLAALPNDGVDAFIIVRPDHEYETPGLPGLAMDIQDAGIFSKPPPRGWANYEIDVIDAHSFATLASAYSRIQLRDGTKPDFAGFVCGEGLRPGDGLSFSEKQLSLLHAAFSKLLDVSLLETLRAMDLGAALPAVGARSIAPLPSDRDPFAAIKTVAVASAIGDELHFDHLGATILSQSHETMPIADWHADGDIEAEMREMLAQRFAVKDAAVDHTALLKARLLDPDGRLKPEFPALQSGSDIDAYVIVFKHPIRLWNSADTYGVGVWNHAPLMLAKTNAVYAAYAIAVLDARTLKPILAAAGTVDPSYPTSTPVREIDAALWPEHISALTPAQKDGIRAGLSRLLRDSVAETLLRMGLTGKMVSSGSGAISATPQ